MLELQQGQDSFRVEGGFGVLLHSFIQVESYWHPQLLKLAVEVVSNALMDNPHNQYAFVHLIDGAPALLSIIQKQVESKYC